MTGPGTKPPALDREHLRRTLDLDPFETDAELVAVLQRRRADELASLAAPWPEGLPAAAAWAVVTASREDVRVCEAALDVLGAPHTAEETEA